MRWVPVSIRRAGASGLLTPMTAAVIAAVLAVGCQSDAETPNAYWGMDGGVSGEIGQPCRNNSRCNDAVAVCIDEDTNDSEPPYCRTGCDITATNDPCGVGLLCVGIQNQGNNGACLPAPLLGEECTTRCDDTMVCVNTAVDGGVHSECATECDDDTDCTAPQTCAAGGYCS